MMKINKIYKLKKRKLTKKYRGLKQKYKMLKNKAQLKILNKVINHTILKIQKV